MEKARILNIRTCENPIYAIKKQDELTIMVISQMFHKTEIKGIMFAKMNAEMREELEVRRERDNVVEKYAVCLKTELNAIFMQYFTKPGICRLKKH